MASGVLLLLLGHLVRGLLCPRYGLVHDAHEGAHAIAQSFGMQYGSVEFLEVFDVRNWYDVGDLKPEGKKSRARAIRSFLAGRMSNFNELLRQSRYDLRHTTLPTDSMCSRGLVTGALMRPDMSWHLAASAGIVYFVLVRTDLERWALSFPPNGDCRDPQFRSCTLTPGKVSYPLAVLKERVTKLLFAWRLKLSFVDSLLEKVGNACDLLHIVTYEQFLARPEAVIRGLMGSIVRAAKAGVVHFPRDVRGIFPNATRFWIPFQKQHSNVPQDFVANYDEVKALFAAEKYPTWEGLLMRSNYSRVCLHRAGS